MKKENIFIRTKEIIFVWRKDQPLELDIVALQAPNEFDILLKFLIEQYKAIVIDRYDGLDVRKYKLAVGKLEFYLVYDDWFGNSIVATNEDSENMVEKIGKDLQVRLKDLNFND